MGISSARSDAFLPETQYMNSISNGTYYKLTNGHTHVISLVAFGKHHDSGSLLEVFWFQHFENMAFGTLKVFPCSWFYCVYMYIRTWICTRAEDVHTVVSVHTKLGGRINLTFLRGIPILWGSDSCWSLRHPITTDSYWRGGGENRNDTLHVHMLVFTYLPPLQRTIVGGMFSTERFNTIPVRQVVCKGAPISLTLSLHDDIYLE